MMGRMYAPKPKCVDTDYIDFLIASPKAFCCTEAAKPCNPSRPMPRPTTPSPGCSIAWSLTPPRSGTRPGRWPAKRAACWPSTTRPWTSSLRQEDRPRQPPLVGQAQAGRLGHQPDHPRLDRWRYGRPLRLPGLRQGQGRPDQERPLPGDAQEAKARGFEPSCVAFDTWYSGLENLKAVRACGWTLPDPVEGQPRGRPRPPGDTGPSPRWRSPPAGRSCIWKGSGRSASSRWSPETETLNTGRPTT